MGKIKKKNINEFKYVYLGILCFPSAIEYEKICFKNLCFLNKTKGLLFIDEKKVEEYI